MKNPADDGKLRPVVAGSNEFVLAGAEGVENGVQIESMGNAIHPGRAGDCPERGRLEQRARSDGRELGESGQRVVDGGGEVVYGTVVP
jgi:hypothetical protein